MKKKIIAVALSILLIASGTVYAADPLYRMTHPESFPGDQDAMILGQITGIEGEISTIAVLKVLNGSVESGTIRIDGKFTYLGFSREHYDAKVGDFCIIAVKKYGETYKVKYPDRAVLADSGDYKTLRCLHDEENPQGGDVPAIQWYANSGGTENGFGFSSGRAYVTRPNGEIVDITNISVMVTFDQSGNMIIPDSDDSIIPNPQTGSSFDFTGTAAAFILIGVVLLIAKSKLTVKYK